MRPNSNFKMLGEYEQKAVYKRYNVVGNDPDSVLETSCWIYVLISKYNGWVFCGRDEPYFACTHSASADDRHCNQAYLPGTGDTVMT